MYIWELLGIEPTSDVRAVKRAYAGKLKQTHPEDDPEGYQRLREAYDRAVKEAKWRQQHGIEDDDDDDEIEDDVNGDAEKRDPEDLEDLEDPVYADDSGESATVGTTADDETSSVSEQDHLEGISSTHEIAGEGSGPDPDSQSEPEPQPRTVPRFAGPHQEIEEVSQSEADAEDHSEDYTVPRLMQTAQHDYTSEDADAELVVPRLIRHVYVSPEPNGGDAEDTAQADEGYDGYQERVPDASVADAYMHQEPIQDEEAYDEHDRRERADDLRSYSPIAHTLEADVDENVESDNIDTVEAFMEHLEDIYYTMAERVRVENWAALLSADVMWNASIQEELSEEVLDFMEEHYFVPPSVWGMLDQAFGWKEKMLIDPDIFAEQYTNVRLYAFHPMYETDLGYSYVAALEDELAEQYLELREEAYHALRFGRRAQAGIKLEEAEAILSADPDLLRLRIRFAQISGQEEEILEYCTRYLQLDPTEEEIALIRARIWIRLGQAAEAEVVVTDILRRNSDHREALNLLGQCQQQTGRYPAARETYQRLMELDPEDLEACFSYHEVNKAMAQQAPWWRRRSARRSLGYTDSIPRLMFFLFASVRNNATRLIGIGILAFLFSISFHADTGVSVLKYLSSLQNTPGTEKEYREVISVAELEHSSGAPLVRMTLQDVRKLDDLYIVTTDNGATQYMDQTDLKKQRQSAAQADRIVIGALGKHAIPVRLSTQQAESIVSGTSFTVEGQVVPLTTGALRFELDKWSYHTENNNYFKSHPLADMYLEGDALAEAQAAERGHPSAVSWLFGILLFLFITSMLMEVYRRWKQYRYKTI
ncbi:tetratricopeptide repeat protein [Paenibacillus sp. FSL K6-1230]|uniref:tetratricopeptide repeat protein n=1 Tax=Paenibacillus sp. FSL K6-1230 TaxID=2921603 RepID=UPI0030FCA6AB